MKVLAGAAAALLVVPACFDANVGESGPHIQTRWVLPLGGEWNDRAESLAIDPAGDVLVAGVFRHEMDFGGGLITSPQPPRCCTLYYSSGFVTKRSGSDGAHQWTLTVDGDVDAGISAVATDAAGNVYVTGGILDFGGDATRPPESRMFTIALAPNGVERWRRELPPSSISGGGAIAVTSDGTSYVVGSFSGTVDLGNGPIEAVKAGNWWSSLVVAYAPDGALLWGRTFSGEGGLTTIALAPDGDLVLAGEISGTFSLGDVELAAQDRADSLLARLDAHGAIEWAQLITPTEHSVVVHPKVTVTSEGVIAMTASETQDAGDGPPNYLTTRTFTPSGTPVASSMVHGADGTRPAVSPTDELIVGGRMNGFWPDFGSGQIPGRIYIAAFDDDTTPRGAIGYSPIVEGPPQGGSLDAIDATSHGLTVAGWFMGPLDLGTGAFESGIGDEDIVIAMYDWDHP